MKIIHHISTWVMVGLLVVLVLGLGALFKYQLKSNNSNSNWKAELTAQNKTYEDQMSKGQVPQQVVDSYQNIIAENNYRIEHNVPPISSDSLWGFVIMVAGTTSLITLFSIIIGSGIVSSEFSAGTIKLLLIRPSKRWKILLSKYLTVIIYTLAMLILLFVTSFLWGGLLFGFKGVTTPYLESNNGHFTEVNIFVHILTVYGYACVKLIMMVTFAFMISTLFRNNALAIGLAIFFMFVGSTIVAALSSYGYTWVKYILFANTDLTQYVNGTPVVSGMTLRFSVIVLIVYFVIFNVISWLGFTKRDAVS